MTTFKLGDAAVVCESKSTRNGFKHVATLLVGGYERGSVKCLYLNRTWESYQYQSVFHKALDMARSDKNLSRDKVRRFKKKYANKF